MSQRVYEVQSVNAKRLKGDQWEYFLKWKGFGRKHDSWEPEKNLHCSELVATFEKSRLGKIFGIKFVDNEIVYLMLFSDTKIVEELKSGNATEYWPQAVISFFEERIKWTVPTLQSNSENSNEPEIPEATSGMNGDPIRISYVTNVTGKLLMWVEWPNGNSKCITAKKANKNWPSLVIRFYEKHIHFD